MNDGNYGMEDDARGHCRYLDLACCHKEYDCGSKDNQTMLGSGNRGIPVHVTAIGDACARHRQGLENAKSLQFQVTVKGGDPEEVALIINTLGEVPPQKVAIADNSCNVGAVGLAVVFQKSVGTNLVSSDAIAAVLGVMMVCGVIAGKRERKSNPSSFAYKSR